MSNMNNTNATNPAAELNTPAPSVTCTHCGKPVDDPLFPLVVNGNAYCNACYEELFTECFHCGRPVLRDDAVDHVDVAYCPDCFDNQFTTCEACGCVVPRSDAHSYRGDDYCFDCYCDNFYTCDGCGEVLPDFDAVFVGYDVYCPSCYHDRFTTCAGCGCEVETEESVSYDGEDFCASCARSFDRIQSYTYKPVPNFCDVGDDDPDFRIKLYMGVELEVDKGRDRMLLAKALCDTTDMLYCKADSSLDDGVEIVTHPCTLAAHRENFPWGDVLAECKSRGFKSHDANTCGLHIHVCRKAFRDERDVFTAVALVDRLRSYIVRFSRRTEEKLNRWAAILDVNALAPFAAYSEVTDRIRQESRYFAVNLDPRDTVEFRFPRGSLCYDTVLGTIELCRNIVLYARSHTPEDAATAVWEDVLNIGAEDGTNAELLRYWAGRPHDGLTLKELDTKRLVPIDLGPRARAGDIVHVNDFFLDDSEFRHELTAPGVFGIVLYSVFGRDSVGVLWFDESGDPLSIGHNLNNRLATGCCGGWNVAACSVDVVRSASANELHWLLDGIMRGGRDAVDALIASRI